MEQLNLDGTATPLSEVAPGFWAPSKPSVPPIDETALGYWVRNPSAGPDAYTLRAGPRWVKIDSRLAGLLSVSTDTIRRLAAAGFVEIRQPSPELYVLDLDSWWSHLENTDPAVDPMFWDPESENRNKYLFYNGLGGISPEAWSKNNKRKEESR